jgi:ssRNA-specific RNase YbeY (16S rRNA maturation enzyme)
MQQIVGAYYDDNDEHPVISFCYREMEDEFPLKDGLEDLGEIILNAEYSGELDPPSHEASEGQSMEHWAEHATLHLIGVHHE